MFTFYFEILLTAEHFFNTHVLQLPACISLLKKRKKKKKSSLSKSKRAEKFRVV